MAIYFIQAGDAGPIKVGFTVNVAKRLASIQSGHWLELRLLGAIPGTKHVEAVLHAEIAEHRIRGEWFHPSPAVRDLVRRMTDGQSELDLTPTNRPRLPTAIDRAIGQRIAGMRRARKITQKSLAKDLGLTNTAIANYELGFRRADWTTLTRMAHLFGVAIEDIVGQHLPVA